MDRIIRYHGGTGTTSATESESGSSSYATAKNDIPGHTEEEWEDAGNLSLSLEEDGNQRENLVVNTEVECAQAERQGLCAANKAKNLGPSSER